MKAKIILIILLFIYIVSNAQNNNPYEIYGYKTNVIYETRVSEFLYIKNNDTLSETKAIAFNIEDGLILFLGNNDSVINISVIQPEQLLHWFSIDPLANKYAGWSPYNFVENNPISLIDRNGDSTAYYAENGNLLFISNDKLRNAIVIVRNEDINSFMRWKNITINLHLQNNGAMNTLLRRYGTGYDYNSIVKFFNEALNKKYLSLKYKGYYKEISAYTYFKNGLVTVGNERRVGDPGNVSLLDKDPNTESTEPQEPYFVGTIHSHPNVGKDHEKKYTDPKCFNQSYGEGATYPSDYNYDGNKVLDMSVSATTIMFTDNKSPGIDDHKITVKRNDIFKQRPIDKIPQKK